MLCARAAQQFKPLVIHDTTKSAICRGVFNDSAQTQAFLGVPIRLPNMASFGYICLTHQQPREWRADEVAFVSQLAASITQEIMLRMALDNRKNTHDPMRLVRLYAMLLRASGLKNAAKTTGNDAVNEVLNWLMAQSSTMFNANHGFAYFGRPDAKDDANPQQRFTPNSTNFNLTSSRNWVFSGLFTSHHSSASGQRAKWTNMARSHPRYC